MKAEQVAVTVVLLGAFQTERFLLEELVAAKALAKLDVEASKYIALLPDQIVDIKISSWGRLTVVPERWSLQVSEAPFVRAADLALKCLKEIAATCTVEKMGINVRCWYAYSDPRKRDEVGMRLAPAQNWGGWGRAVADSMALAVTDPRHGGLISAAMRQGKAVGRTKGHIDVRVDGTTNGVGSSAVLGIDVHVNDHYEFDEKTIETDSPHVRTAKMMDLLEELFDESVHNSMKVADSVISGQDLA